MVQPHPFDLVPNYVHEQVHRINERSGVEFVVVIQDVVPDDHSLKWPTREHPFHVLTLNASLKPHLNHLLMQSTSKLLRIYEMPPDERVVPKEMLDGRLPPHYELELSASFDFRTDDLEKRSRQLYSAMTSLLTNTPVDLRCEHLMHDCFPQHRTEQRRFLECEIKVRESLMRPDDDEANVPHVHLASSTINTAYIIEASDIINATPPGDTLTGSYSDIACDLLERLHAEPDPSYQGDRRIVDTWTRELGFEGWYDWQPLPQI